MMQCIKNAIWAQLERMLAAEGNCMGDDTGKLNMTATIDGTSDITRTEEA